MCFAKAPKEPDPVEEPIDRESDVARRAQESAAARRRSSTGESDTDIVGSIVANDNGRPQVNTQLKKLMGATE